MINICCTLALRSSPAAAELSLSKTLKLLHICPIEANKSQLERFREATSELGTDDNEERFNEKLKKLVKQKPRDDKTSGDRSSLSRCCMVAQKDRFIKYTIALN